MFLNNFAAMNQIININSTLGFFKKQIKQSQIFVIQTLGRPKMPRSILSWK